MSNNNSLYFSLSGNPECVGNKESSSTGKLLDTGPRSDNHSVLQHYRCSTEQQCNVNQKFGSSSLRNDKAINMAATTSGPALTIARG